MRALIWAELYKLYRQPRTYYALGAIVLMEVVILFSAYYQGSALIDVLMSTLKQSFYFKGDLLNGNLLVYVILNTIWFHLPLLLMIIVSGLLTSEYKDGTLRSIFVQPVSKSKFVLSKYFVAMLFTMVAIFFLMLTAFGLSYTIFGRGDLIVYLDTLNFFENNDAMWRLFWAYLSGTVTMMFYSVMSLTIAIFFRDTTITWILATFFLILSNLMLRVDFGTSLWGKLLYVKLGESWQHFFYYDINWQEIVLNNTILLGYTAIVMGFGILVFKHRDIA